ncbi:O-antigen ligase family protein [Pseudomonas sp. CrR25]|nr:O-antigen ligase family protein [Pseudomonas sp. CrR25]
MSKNVSDGLLPSAWWGRLLYLAIGFAFLQPLHVSPLPSYLEDFFLGLSAVLLGGALLWCHGRIYVNGVFWGWLAFGGLLAISISTVPLPFRTHSNLYTGFWLAGLAIVQLAAHCSQGQGAETFSWRLAKYLAVISVLSAVLGFVRYYGLAGVVSLYYPEPGSGRMVGLIEQSNLFAFLCLLGVFSLVWLRVLGRCNVWVYYISVLVLFYCLVLAGSRTPYVVFGVVALAVFLSKKAESRRFGLVLLLLGALFLAYRPCVLLLNEVFSEWLRSFGLMPWSGSVGANVERGFSSQARLEEWQVAWFMLWDNLPWGVGPGGYAAQSYAGHLEHGFLPMIGLFGHSHNSYLQILVEFGLPGLLWMSFMGGVVLKALWRLLVTGEVLMVAVVLGLLVYSFFEYPLWFMSYFVLFVWVIASCQEGRAFELQRLYGLPVVGVSILLMVVYFGLFVDMFRGHVDRMRPVRDLSVDYYYVDRMIATPFLEMYGYLTYFANFQYSESRLNDELLVLERFKRTSPFIPLMARYSISLAAAGRKREALEVAGEILRLQPSYSDKFRREIFRAKSHVPNWEIDYLLGFNGL